jgi:hypothetical protein
VILHANGHSHSNRLWPYSSERNGSAYWEINTASVADHPHNSRSVEIAGNGDGTLSIYGVLFETGVGANPRRIDWHRHDPTSEVALAHADHDINEDWLASLGLEEAAQEIRDKRIGTRADRNVELVIPDPLAAMGDVRPASAGAVPWSVAGMVSVTLVAVGWGRRRLRREPPDRPKPRRLRAPAEPNEKVAA